MPRAVVSGPCFAARSSRLLRVRHSSLWLSLVLVASFRRALAATGRLCSGKGFTAPEGTMSMMRSTLALAALSALAACVSPEDHRRALSTNQALKAEIASLTAAQHAISMENEKLRAEIARLGKQAADADWIREQQDKLDKLIKQYQGGAGSGIDGVDVIRTSEGVAFRVLGGVLFSPGSVEIREQGQKTLLQLMTTLKAEGKRVRIDGHTDDQSIVRSKWGTNLRLSAERAIAVAEFLTKNGMAADQVGVAGFGEHRPTAQGKTDEARQQNRRVEILMLDK